jgi:V/A-type H+-transporting ATPase subunit E
MPLEQLLQRIRDDAEAEAARLKREAAQERDAILAEAKAEAEAAAERIVQDAARDAESILERARASGELEGRKRLLAAKQHMIQRALEQAIQTLAELADETYRDTVADMMVRAAQSLGGGEIEVIVSKEDRARVTTAFLISLSRRGGLGEGTSFRLSEESRQTGGGFILRKGKIESNGTFPALSKARQEDLEALAAELLFGDS